MIHSQDMLDMGANAQEETWVFIAAEVQLTASCHLYPWRMWVLRGDASMVDSVLYSI